MLKEKIILIFISIIMPVICFSQQIDESMLQRLQGGRRTLSSSQYPLEDSLELGKKALVEEAETLSTIEKMFNEKYMITPRRIRLELLKDSLKEQVKAESLKIELRGKYLTDTSLQAKYLIPADTTYFHLSKKLSKVKKQLDSISVTLRQFGYDMFQKSLKEMPVFAPVADNYILGPGDELHIDISGELNNSWILNINRDGSIVLPYIGNIKLWGRTYGEGKQIISDEFHKEFSNIEVSVSLGYLKSVSVFVMGEFNKPGVYDIIVPSNPLSPLFEAEGPKKSGSLRKIKYISNNGATDIVDLYKLLIEGKPLPFLQFSSGDMILVPPIGKVVGINGAVNRSGIYELNSAERLSELIEMAGGFLPTAGKKRIQLERISAEGKKIIEDLTFANQNDLERISKSTKLENGDLISVLEIPPYLHNYVEISGNVNSEGTYAFKEGMTVSDLIEEAGGLLAGTYLERAELLRFTGVENPEIIKINLKNLQEESSEENIKLKEWDKLRILKKDDVEEKFFVRVDGEVENPGSFPLNPNMKVEDLVFIARPLISSQGKAELFRIDLDKGIYVQQIDITNKNDLKIELKPDDHIHINEKTAYREIGHVLLTGEFKFPGWYDIIVGTTLGELIDMAGGFTENAYHEAAVFTKKSVKKLQTEALDNLIKETRLRLLAEQRAIMGSISSEEDKLAQMQYIKMQEQQLESIKQIQDPGRVVINLNDPNQLNIPLENGDEINVPRSTGTVQVIGEVYNATGVAYKQRLSLNDYLEIAGGPKPTANIKEIYIRRASGEVEKGNIRSASGKMGSSVKIKPGDTIIVPEKVRIGRSGWEVLAFTADILYKIGLAVAAFAVIVK
ncbi:SLBB domain-containing protein [candidate division WOR-3 bacterium]|nr:SLBB domain-containing protein [candidate division WOR-3 bacterium]